MLRLKVLLFDKRVIAGFAINILLTVLFQYSVEHTTFYLNIYYMFIFNFVIVSLLIFGQSHYFNMYNNDLVITRCKSDLEVYINIVLSDLIYACIFSLISIITASCITVLNFDMKTYEDYQYQYPPMMFTVIGYLFWPFVITVLKHLINLVIKNYAYSNLIIITLILIAYMQDYVSIYNSPKIMMTLIIFESAVACMLFNIKKRKLKMEEMKNEPIIRIK